MLVYTMRIGIETQNGRPYLVLKYRTQDWEAMKEVYEEEFGLSKSTTKNGLGRGVELTYYLDEESALHEYISQEVEKPSGVVAFQDDIKSSVFANGILNTAILRIVPDRNMTVRVPLFKFFHREKVKRLATIYANVVRAVFSIPARSSVDLDLE